MTEGRIDANETKRKAICTMFGAWFVLVSVRVGASISFVSIKILSSFYETL